jgi:hypothetical protein
MTRIVEEYEDKCHPEGTEHGKQPDQHSHHHRRRNEISESLHSKESRESITFHGLEDIVLSRIKDFRVITSKFFD